jgi:hypothetical protein
MCQGSVVSGRTAIPVRVGASVLAAVMQGLSGFVLGFASLVLVAVLNPPHGWEVWPILLVTLLVAGSFGSASIWLQGRSQLIAWLAWPFFVLTGFVGFWVLLALTAKGD